MTDTLRAVIELLHGSGAIITGLVGDEARAEAAAILHYSGKPYCLVKDWIIIDLDVDDGFRNELLDAGFEATILYASDVVLHSAGKRQRGDWVRSTFQRSFKNGYLFETKNTTYVLMGDGCRNRVSAETVLAIIE